MDPETMPDPIAFWAVVIDFDGVIHKYSQGYHDGTCYDPPMDGALDAIDEFMRAGRPTVVGTARPVAELVPWFTEHAPDLKIVVDYEGKIEFWERTDAVLITNRKVVAKHYIDDRAIPHTDWPRTMALLAASQMLDDVGTEAQTMDLT